MSDTNKQGLPFKWKVDLPLVPVTVNSDWLYVNDHCYGILAVLEKGRVGEVYNLGGHNEKANIEIVKIILRSLVSRRASWMRLIPSRVLHKLN